MNFHDSRSVSNVTSQPIALPDCFQAEGEDKAPDESAVR